MTEHISEKQFDLRMDSFSSTVIFEFEGKKFPLKPRVVQVNEFTLAYLQFPGSLIRSLAEHSEFCLDGSQMVTHFWSCAKLSPSCMICSVNDVRLLRYNSPPGLSVEQTLRPNE